MQIMRLLKLGIAAALLCVGLYAVTVGQATITSDNAVLSAYTVSIRAPVAGTFAGTGLRVGDNVLQGAVLGRLHDDLVDKQHLADLLGQAERSSAERQAFEKQRVSLFDLRAGLLRRAADFQSTEQDYSAQGVEEALRTLQARMTRSAQSRRDLERKLSLTRVGFAPVVDLEHLQADLAVSDNEIAAQAARVAKTRIQQVASRRGLLLDNGSNDASYSNQRADDITLRLTEIDRAIASFTAAETETRDRLASERQRLSRLQDAVLTAPSAGCYAECSDERVDDGCAGSGAVRGDAPLFNAVVARTAPPLGSNIGFSDLRRMRPAVPLVALDLLGAGWPSGVAADLGIRLPAV